MTITVFTPTYNRAYILPQLYRSLQRQTCTDFEWLIVDDGSSDHTAELAALWQREENPFPIRYYRKGNEGKCQAINYALSLAQGDLFFTVDSDDYLTQDAIAWIFQTESTLPHNGQYCGFAANMGTSETHTPNPVFGSEYVDGTLLDRYHSAGGERSYIFYTKIHRQYLYPYFPGENFMTEAIAWNRMAHDGYRIRYFNYILCVYQYQSDGLTCSGTELFLRNPYGFGLFLREKARFQKYSLQENLKMWYTFTCDLSGRYPSAQIADFIKAPGFLIWFFRLVHRFIQHRKVSI